MAKSLFEELGGKYERHTIWTILIIRRNILSTKEALSL